MRGALMRIDCIGRGCQALGLALLALLIPQGPAQELVQAEELLSPEASIAEVVDHYVGAKLDSLGVAPVDVAAPATLVRRITLDLVGRPPTVHESREFITSTSQQRRAELLDRLFADPGFVRHQANEFDHLLMAGGESIREYLLQAFGDGRNWDEIFRELLLGREDDAQQTGALRFVKTRVSDLDKLTNQTSVVFFGVNISCAKCHDHPHVSEWTQDHFYGMKSFFNRTFDNGGLLGEREYGLVKFKTTAGESRQASLMFLNGTVLEEPLSKDPTSEEQKAEKAKLEALKKKKQPPPAPAFSRRAKLVEVALQAKENNYFARAIVNKIWHRFFGVGLVMPIDQMHPENPPSHPQLIAWLARDLVAHKYDLKRLMRGLQMSQTYARSSRYAGEQRPDVRLFATAVLRPLSRYQYATTLRMGSMNPDRFVVSDKIEELQKQIESQENAARGFAGQIEQPYDGFQIGVTEALLMNNAAQVEKEFLSDSGDSLVGKLKTIADPRELVEAAVWTVLNRPPDEQEIKSFEAYLARRADRKLDSCRQLVWALLTSSECRFNY